MDLYHFISHGDMGSTGAGSSSWGWVADDGREFITIGQEDGTTFAEISSESKLIVLARLPQVSLPSDWREIRSYKNYMIIGSEAVDHGIQIFDMTKLLDIDVEASGVVIYDALDDLTGYTNDLPIGRSHNVVVNEEKDYIVAVGSQPRDDECLSGLIFFDVSDPSDPVRLGCAAGDGYVHDVSDEQMLFLKDCRTDSEAPGSMHCLPWTRQALRRKGHLLRLQRGQSYHLRCHRQGQRYQHHLKDFLLWR